ncbi:protein ATP1B4 isoform X1 [Maylandia zebra]|uniref:Sodium/potassium-transporting ATPase subunit beta n=2 Tax=Haplochromini TaxID=319058 RepID=A0A3P9BK70_9CICH|nr:protein ATP1B4 isoform X1 [Maylandia zebra]XP_024657802.1 protein ATP1B4-like isoform X1 [Maylandia zebra]XP_026001653.1 protein ATP1B4 isoform X1 [Astatotilapia calliptera]
MGVTERYVTGVLMGSGMRTTSPEPHKVILKHGQELEEEQEELAEHQPLEQEDLNFERWKRRPIPKRTLHQKIDDLKTYLWNAETNEFMGRSGKSWSLILLFYAALYLFLAAMFGGCLFCLMWSISPYHPTFNDRVMPPGMTMAPHLEGHEIAFNASDRKSWRKYARSMEEYLRPYNDAAQQRKNIPCDKETYFMQDDLDEAAERKACQFKRSWLGQCSGLQDANFGYSQGMPCILLRMNRILGYLPGQGKPINVTCGVKKGPPEVLGKIEFFPKSIFENKYYPYYGKLRHVNYSSPVVAVRFTGVQQGANIQVQCKLNGKGIINDSPTDRYLGSVTFSLEVGA